MQAPEGLPDDCPFGVQWTPLCVVVALQPGLEEMAIKKELIKEHEFKCLHFGLEATAIETAAEAGPLKDSLVKARAECGEPFMPPPELALQLLQLRSERDKELGWKVEWARRQKAVQNSTEQLEVCHFMASTSAHCAITVSALPCRCASVRC